MELKYIVMTIIKILISVPSILVINDAKVQAVALMGGYLDNTSNSTSLSNSSILGNSYENIHRQTNYSSVQITPSNSSDYRNVKSHPSDVDVGINDDFEGRTEKYEGEEEEIPNPSPLVVPGYNLPENIFNKGKPFYLEKDPLTGKVDFDSKTSLLNVEDDEFDYTDENNEEFYDKSNIDRKDGNIGSHKASDVNQLTPNFHDFLNLPVKYNPDKYVYPLISSSYANTKVQGNLHKYQMLNNHKAYTVTTYKPTASPNYLYTLKTPYYDPNNNDNPKQSAKAALTSSSTTTTTTTTTTTHRPITTTTTTKSPNLMDNFMNHALFEDFTTQKLTPSEIYITTKNINDVYLTTKRYSPPPTTTKRPLSLFEQLFGEYEDEYITNITTTEKPSKPPSLFQNLPSNKNRDKYDDYEDDTARPSERPQQSNILSGTDMGHEAAYEYEDDYGSIPSESINTIYQTKPVKFEIKSTIPASTSTLVTSTTTTPTIRSATKSTISTTRITRTTTTPPTTTTTRKPSTTSNPYLTTLDSSEYDDEYQEENDYLKKFYTSTDTTTSAKVTSLPLGENHFGTPNFRPPIIAMTNNIKQQLNNEKVITNTNNIRIPPEQDSISFVVGNQQTVGDDGSVAIGGGGFVGSAFKEGPFDNSPFRPLIVQPGNDKDTVTYTVEAKPEFVNKPIFSQDFSKPYKPQISPKLPEVGGSSINIHPIKTSEASLSIGVPINGIKKIPGQVVDENLENEKIEFPKQGTGAKIVFPNDKEVSHSTFAPNLKPPPLTREVLQLSSKPMYHQLPSDLTPPSEQDLPPPHLERPRPPWDPRPGHFYNGRPEYIRPPRPQPKPGDIYKRIDNLPNILPQFRPNAKVSSVPHYFDHFASMKNGYVRQPLLERPSNRPVGFFEKLVPPPPPKNLHNLRKVPLLEQDLRIKNIADETNVRKHEKYEYYQHETPPPQPVLINRRKSEEPTIETLQMIQAKQIEKKDVSKSGPTSVFKMNLKGKDATEKPLYVVYPVNSAPIKLDALDSGKKETVVVGTRAELPLPPSKIKQEFNYESPKDRNDAPILKPHSKPPNFPLKSDFPYPLERPDITPIMTSSSTFPTSNNLDLREDSKFASNNQWGAVQDIESRILTGPKINYKSPNQISATLKTYTDKPIAVAYTPTEPYKKQENTEKYSMPNYASPVISEIRPSGLMDKSGSEITVSAVMHTHPQMEHSIINSQNINGELTIYENHKIDTGEIPTKLDFQAPFQASLNIDGMSQGWTVVRNNNNNNNDKSKINRSDQEEETTTIAIATTSEFDMKNFKPQFFGGFKPIYSYPDDGFNSEESEGGNREAHIKM